jgi:hypothetical protein
MSEVNESSLKHFNFTDWTPDKIIEKYEIVLASREKQITDLSIEMGDNNNKISILTEKCNSLEHEVNDLKGRLNKSQAYINQELNNKEIMFMRLERAEQERDELKKKLEEIQPAKKGFFGNIASSLVNQISGTVHKKEQQNLVNPYRSDDKVINLRENAVVKTITNLEFEEKKEESNLEISKVVTAITKEVKDDVKPSNNPPLVEKKSGALVKYIILIYQILG